MPVYTDSSQETGSRCRAAVRLGRERHRADTAARRFLKTQKHFPIRSADMLLLLSSFFHCADERSFQIQTGKDRTFPRLPGASITGSSLRHLHQLFLRDCHGRRCGRCDPVSSLIFRNRVKRLNSAVAGIAPDAAMNQDVGISGRSMQYSLLSLSKCPYLIYSLPKL